MSKSKEEIEKELNQEQEQNPTYVGTLDLDDIILVNGIPRKGTKAAIRVLHNGETIGFIPIYKSIW